MRVKILSDIFQNASNEVDLNHLNHLLVFFKQARHSLVVADIDAWNDSNWKQELNSRDRKVVEMYIRSSTKQEKAKKTISISNIVSPNHFSLEAACLFLNQPLIVLMENSEYDAPFLNAIIKNFDDGTLLAAKENQWWKYGMGGGTSIEQVIESELNESFGNAAFTASKKEYLRYFVIIDSDKKFPEMIVNKVENIKMFFKSHDIQFHVLYKREKENYMPKNVLLKLNDAYFNLYCKFDTPDQKDYFDLEKGFNGKNQADKDWDKEVNWNKEIAKLFNIQKIPKSDFDILKTGVKGSVYDKNFKTEFSKLFLLADKASMLSAITHQPKYGYEQRNELEHIVHEIKKIL